LEDDYYHYARKGAKYLFFILLFGSIFFSYIEILSSSGSNDWGGGVGHTINFKLFNYIGQFGVGVLILFAVIIFTVINFKTELKASQLLESLRAKAAQTNKNSGSGRSKTPRNRPQKTKAPNTTPVVTNAVSVKESLSKVLGIKEETNGASTAAIVNSPVEISNAPVAQSRNLPPKTTATRGEEVKFELMEPKIEEVKDKSQLELTIVPSKDEPVIEFEPKKLEQIGEDNIGRVVGEGDKVEKIVPEKDQEIDNIEGLDWEEFDPTLELSSYERPPFELLEDHGGGGNREVNRNELETNKNKIVKTLSDYGISIDKIKATIGPTVTLYEIVPAAGVRISKIRNLEDDIALNLAALGIRIIAPMPGKGTIGIEVPNSSPEIVSLRGVLTTEKFLTTKAELPIAIGRTISNEVFIGDLNKMPHLLIAGATGQGKSVGLNTVIASLLYKKHPAEIKFVMIDPKKVELSLFSVIQNHFLATLPEQEEPIITDVRQAVTVLKSLCIEMDRRYDLLKKARVRNLKEYNKKFQARKLNPRKGHEFMPYIVLIIDELADMMMVAGKEVEMPIARLAQLARAVGIHLVIATQRPSVNVITGIIKANFPARMSYRVISKVDSRTILDANGADQLIGRGDVLLSTGSDLIRIQNAFIDTPEIERIVDHIAKQRGYPEPYFLPETPDEDSKGRDEDEPFEKDQMFEEAARMIVRYQMGSASLLQRKLKLGYNRAGRIIDQLERVGIVGPHSGSKARDVLVTDEAELERYLNDLA
ncbi:MAG: DNA translocase FtsK, partial [Bacteroidota bacterium]